MLPLLLIGEARFQHPHSRSQKKAVLMDDVGDKEEREVQSASLPCLLQCLEEGGHEPLAVIKHCHLALSDTELLPLLLIALEIALEQGERIFSHKRGAVAEKLLRVGLVIAHLGNLAKVLHRHAVRLGGSRALQSHRVTSDSRKKHLGYLQGERHPAPPVQGPDDGARGAKRIAKDVNRLVGVDAVHTMVVDDFKNLRILQSGHALVLLVVVHKDDLRPWPLHEAAAADKTKVLVSMEDRHGAVLSRMKPVLRLLKEHLILKMGQLLAKQLPHLHGKPEQPERLTGIHVAQKNGSLEMGEVDRFIDLVLGASKDNAGNLGLDGLLEMAIPVPEHPKRVHPFLTPCIHVLAEEFVLHGAHCNRTGERGRLPLLEKLAGKHFADGIDDEMVRRTLLAGITEEEGVDSLGGKQPRETGPVHHPDCRWVCLEQGNKRGQWVGDIHHRLSTAHHGSKVGPHILEEGGSSDVKLLEERLGRIIQISGTHRDVGVLLVLDVLQVGIRPSTAHTVHIRIAVTRHKNISHAEILHEQLLFTKSPER